MPRRHERAGIVGQEIKRNALDNADESQLDIHHDGIELAPAFSWRLHDPINGSMTELSRRSDERALQWQ